MEKKDGTLVEEDEDTYHSMVEEEKKEAQKSNHFVTPKQQVNEGNRLGDKAEIKVIPLSIMPDQNLFVQSNGSANADSAENETAVLDEHVNTS